MKFFNKLSRKMRCLLERIRLSESDYRTMKARAQMYQSMMSTIKYDVNTEYEDAVDELGNLIRRTLKARNVTAHINVEEMLAEGGITFDKRVDKLDIRSDMT